MPSSISSARPAGLAALKPHYRSGADHLGQDFFEPCLTHCERYQRASGFFSSKSLLTWVSVLPRLIRAEATTVELLVSPTLSRADRAALQKVTDPEQRKELQVQVADEMVEEALELLKDPEDDERRLKLFAWLVANDRLKIRFAFPEHIKGADLFHEKLGVFWFPGGAQVAFTGSANETLQGHSKHYESVDVYRSWVEGDAERVQVKVEQFGEAWNGQAVGLEVVELSKRVLSRIKEFASGTVDPPVSQPSLDPWRHQDEAIEEFMEIKAGVLEMATGTGKTRTALRIMERLLDRDLIDGVIVSTIGTDLLDQWYLEIQERLFHRRLSVYRHFGPHHDIGRFASHPEDSILIVSRQALKSLFSMLQPKQRRRLFIVHDEVHGLGSPSSVRDLKGEHPHFPYRLGLSATPEREYDPEGTEFIMDELGDVFYRFGLEDAIRRGILCEFDYVPLSYNLTEDDRQRLKRVFSLRTRRKKEGDPMPETELWRRLAAVYKTAEEKPDVFADYLSSHPDALNSSILFVHTMEYGSSLLDLVHHHTSRYSTYYADDQRSRLVSFANGELDCLITCHRISQGIDIRHLRTIVLFSADAARLETIQRIGRCLRVDPDNPEKRALVVDFVRSSDDSENPTRDEERASWLSELASVRRNEGVPRDD